MKRSLFALLITGVTAWSGTAMAQTSFTASLDGTQTIPPAISQATGTCIGTLSADEAEFTFTCTHNIRDATDGHIHAGAFGTGGDVVFEFADGACCPPTSTWFLTAADAATLKAGNLYVNIHSEIFTAEEIRGQLVTSGGDTTTPGGDTDTEFQGVCGNFGLGCLLPLFGLLVALRFRPRGRSI